MMTLVWWLPMKTVGYGWKRIISNGLFLCSYCLSIVHDWLLISLATITAQIKVSHLCCDLVLIFPTVFELIATLEKCCKCPTFLVFFLLKKCLSSFFSDAEHKDLKKELHVISLIFLITFFFIFFVHLHFTTSCLQIKSKDVDEL